MYEAHKSLFAKVVCRETGLTSHGKQLVLFVMETFLSPMGDLHPRTRQKKNFQSPTQLVTLGSFRGLNQCFLKRRNISIIRTLVDTIHIKQISKQICSFKGFKKSTVIKYFIFSGRNENQVRGGLLKKVYPIKPTTYGYMPGCLDPTKTPPCVRHCGQVKHLS